METTRSTTGEDATVTTPRPWGLLICLLILTVVTLAAFGDVSHMGFVRHDDDRNLYHNTLLNPVQPQSLIAFWT